MIRSRSTEYVRIALPAVERGAAEVGRLLVLALERHEHLRREKQRCIEEFRREEEALGAGIADLMREQKGDPVRRHEDVACEVWYDLESGDRILRDPDHERVLDRAEAAQGATVTDVISRRPMTAEERKEAETLAKGQAQ